MTTLCSAAATSALVVRVVHRREGLVGDLEQGVVADVLVGLLAGRGCGDAMYERGSHFLNVNTLS
jgi:hypothetical protein